MFTNKGNITVQTEVESHRPGANVVMSSTHRRTPCTIIVFSESSTFSSLLETSISSSPTNRENHLGGELYEFICDEEPSAMVFATCCILANCPLLTAAVFSGRPTVGSYHVADDKKAKSLENIGRKPKEGNIVAAIIRKSANSWVALGCKDHWNALLFIFLTFLLLRLNISIGQSFFFQKWSRIDRPSWTWRFMFGCSF